MIGVAATVGAWLFIASLILVAALLFSGRVDRNLADPNHETAPLPDITGYAPDRAA